MEWFVSRRWLATTIVTGLLVVQSILLIHSAKVHSPTWDEVGHLAAGISHWELGRFDLYSVNPPLVRVIAAAPVALIAKPSIDWTYYRSSPELRSEVFVGRMFIEQHGEDSFRYFFYARLAIIPIALLGGWLCFLWARELFGVSAGILSLTIWTFSPNVLAYGSVITPDLGAAVAMLGTSFVFYRWLINPSWSGAFALSSVTALAMLTKSVWLTLPMIYASILLISMVAARLHSSPFGSSVVSRRIVWTQLIGASMAAILLTNGFYGFAGSFRPLGKFEFVSTAFSGNQPILRTPCEGCDDQPEIQSPVVEKGNRFANSWLAFIPVPLPANYLQGIDVQTRDFERGRYDVGWKSYLMGDWKQGGWPYFYFLALLVKVPIATWIMVGLGSVMAIFWRPDRRIVFGVICLWMPALALMVLVSCSTGLNRYMRYALPVLPVLFIWASQVGRWLETWSANAPSKARAAIPALLCVWLAGTTLWHSPNYLSYFNTIAGGPSKGHRFLCDSNIDWGQDLIELKTWLARNPAAAKNLYLAYFGSFDPKWVGIDYRLPPTLYSNETRVSLRDPNAMGPLPGWYVVSKNYLAGHSMPVPDGTGRQNFKFHSEPFCTYLNDFTPVANIGESMLVYHLDLEETNFVRVAKGLGKIEQGVKLAHCLNAAAIVETRRTSE